MGIFDVFFNRSKASPKSKEPEEPQERQYLFVSENDRAAVIALGGRYDRDAHTFYVPIGRDRAPFAKWATPNLVHHPEQISEEQKAAFEPEVAVHRQKLEDTLLAEDPALIEHLVEVKRQKLWRNEEEDRAMEKIYAMKKGVQVPDPYLGTRREVKIPYRDLERAQEFGVAWDRTAQRFIIPEDKDPALFVEWEKPSPAVALANTSPSVPAPVSPETRPSVAPKPREAVLRQERPFAFDALPVAGNDRVNDRVVVSAQPSLVHTLNTGIVSARASAPSASPVPGAPSPEPPRPADPARTQKVDPLPVPGEALREPAPALHSESGRSEFGLEKDLRLLEQTLRRNKALSHNPELISQLMTEYRASMIEQHTTPAPFAPVVDQKPDDEKTRHYIFVPFEEKDRVKALGGRFDGKLKSWYVRDGLDRAAFAAWEQPRTAQVLKTDLDPQQEFANFLESEGLRLNGLPNMDGKRHRAPVEGDYPKKMSGSFVGYLDGIPAGTVTNFKNGGVAKTWVSERTVSLSPEELATQKARVAERRHAEERERRAQYDKVAEEAKRTWNTAQDVDDHPYLTRKCILSHTAHVDKNNNLLIPMCDKNGEIRNLQRIAPDGFKFFLTGGEVSGMSYRLNGARGSNTVILAEGFATGATLNEVTGNTVIVCFQASNLPKVAMQLAEEHKNTPGIQFIVAADDDWKNPLKDLPQPNVGLEYGQAAADILGARRISPPLGNAEKERGCTDFNDLYVVHGPEKCREILSTFNAVSTPTRARECSQAIA